MSEIVRNTLRYVTLRYVTLGLNEFDLRPSVFTNSKFIPVELITRAVRMRDGSNEPLPVMQPSSISATGNARQTLCKANPTTIVDPWTSINMEVHGRSLPCQPTIVLRSKELNKRTYGQYFFYILYKVLY